MRQLRADTSRREVAGILLVLAMGIAIRWLFASTIAFPIPEDTAYYVSVARNVVAGRGLVSDAMWSYVTPPLVFPRPAFEIWLPLPTLVLVPLLAALGTSAATAAVMPVVAGGAVIALAYVLAGLVAEDLGLRGSRGAWLRLGVAAAAAVALPLVLHGGLPDSTMLFAALALAAIVLMTVIERSGLKAGRGQLIALGVLLGLAGLTRNEAIWVALTWVGMVALHRNVDPRGRARAILIPAAVAIAVYVPWAIRDWLTFGSPLPGQAALNALSTTGYDIFAYADPPTLGRYLAQGPAALVAERVDAFLHNLLSVLVLPLFPVGVVGLVALPWAVRVSPALRPLAAFSLIAFAVTTLVFPVATTWGTFLHAAGPILVLLIAACLVCLDAAVARLALMRAWTREMGWIGPLFAVASSLLMLVPLTAITTESIEVARRYDALRPALTEALGAPPERATSPVISDFPILYATAYRAPALALPDETPTDVVRLARRFGASYLLMAPEPRGKWPAILSSGAPDAACFQPVPIPTPPDPADAAAIANTHLWHIVCP